MFLSLQVVFVLCHLDPTSREFGLSAVLPVTVSSAGAIHDKDWNFGRFGRIKIERYSVGAHNSVEKRRIQRTERIAGVRKHFLVQRLR